MAIRCLTFLQFSCFKPDITEKEIAHYIGIGEYLWLEYAQAHWLEHVRLGSKADHGSLQGLDIALRSFFGRWQKIDPSVQHYQGTLEGSVFGFGALRNVSSDNYQLLVSGAMYQSQKRFHDTFQGEQFLLLGNIIRAHFPCQIHSLSENLPSISFSNLLTKRLH